MTGDRANTNGKQQLTLLSRISELTRIPSWIEDLAALHAIPEKTQFAMNLCMEEALSNIIRHGYKGAPDRKIMVSCSTPQSGVFLFVVDDEAPPFNPVEAEIPPIPSTLDDKQVGGQGIRLLRKFADTLTYEATPSGNRLTMGFSASPKTEN